MQCRGERGRARYYDSWRGQWLRVDPMAEKYPGWSPYCYVADNPTALLDPDGKEIKNSQRYVIQNPRLVQALIEFNNRLVEITGKRTSEFVMEVTGGDRYRQIVSGSYFEPSGYSDLMVDRSRTNDKVVWNSDLSSPHLEENGARGIDLSYPSGITKAQLKEAALKTGFTQVLMSYTDGHFHLTLGRKNVNGRAANDDLKEGNKPDFKETKEKEMTTMGTLTGSDYGILLNGVPLPVALIDATRTGGRR